MFRISMKTRTSNNVAMWIVLAALVASTVYIARLEPADIIEVGPSAVGWEYPDIPQCDKELWDRIEDGC